MNSCLDISTKKFVFGQIDPLFFYTGDSYTITIYVTMVLIWVIFVEETKG